MKVLLVHSLILLRQPGRLKALLHKKALEIKGDMEEFMVQVKGALQGGRVKVVTAADGDNWSLK